MIWLRWAAFGVAVALCAAAAHGQKTGAQAASPGGIYENRAIRRADGASATTQGSAVPASPRGTSVLDLPRIGAALAIVLGLIFALRWLGRRFVPGVAGGSGLVRVLSRNVVTPKHQILLVQVGRRVLVVGDNGTALSPLSEITDADEVAAILGHLSSGSAADAPNAGVFGAELGQARKDLDQALAPAAEVPLSRSRAEDESLESTSGEIDGLMQKVRVLARQLGR